MNLDMIFNLLILILLICNLVIMIFVRFKPKSISNNRYTDEHFIIIIKVFDMILNNYFTFYLKSEIYDIKKKYDLKLTSQTNAYNKYKKDENKIISNAIQIIIQDYLSNSVRQELSVYFTIDGLIIYAFDQLKMKCEGI